jgi:hypothetical protein
MKENLFPQLRQKPSARPGRPSLLRPTGRSHRPQKRLLSGTCGSASTALAGSRAGIGGISTSPAPRLPLDKRLLPGREPRLPADREPRLPMVLTVGTKTDAEPPPRPADAADAAGTAAPDAAGTAPGTAAGAEGAAAIPQTSQYPPSITPLQPGWVHLVVAAFIAAVPVR